MKNIKILLPLVAVCSLLIGGAPNTAVSKAEPAVVAIDDVGAAANQELAAARRATAKYHDFQQALDDGYVEAPIGCIPGEGIHFRRPDEFPNPLLDCDFDPANPEVLHYAPKPNGELQLVGVEYFVPKSAACGTLSEPPEGFSGDADEWESEIMNTVWALNAWIWQGVPDGVFAFRSDKISCD
ncbi:MAG: hypothetical protein ACRD8U_25570 [Pyrinomonadaceae bacterium]